MLTDQILANMQPHLVKHAKQVATQSAGALATNLGSSKITNK
jgi:hypothetical protein